jgi:hypothetical protein
MGARAGLHVDEVVKEAVLIVSAHEEAQRGEHPLACGIARDVAALNADGISGEPEAYRGDTCEGR